MRAALMSSAVRIDNAHMMNGEAIESALGGNTGNLAFVNAIHLHLKRDAKVVPWNVSPAEIREHADVVILACANQLGVHVDLAGHAKLLEQIGLPILALGLGAQADSMDDVIAIPEGTKRWLEVIADHSPSNRPNLGVRGPFTQSVIERLGIKANVDVIGCPSNFTNLDTDYVGEIEGKLNRPLRRIASAIGQPYWPRLAALERHIIALVEMSGGVCFTQHGKVMIQLGAGDFSNISDRQFEAARSYFKPELTGEQFAYWCRRYLMCFGSVEQWMFWIQKHDFVLGPRFHGIMLAIQAGVPAGCIAHDSRTLEMCQTMSIPVKNASELANSDLYLGGLANIFKFNPQAYKETRRILARRYCNILTSAGLRFHEKLEVLAYSDISIQ